MRLKFALPFLFMVMLLLVNQVSLAELLSAKVESNVSTDDYPLKRFELLNAKELVERLPFEFIQDRKINEIGSLLPLAPQSPSATTQDWHIDCVECPKYFLASDHSLRLDGDNHPHIAYGGDHLYYAWYDAASWHYETVDNDPKVGSSASLVLDVDGNPHISYFDNGNGNIKYAHRLNGDWQIQTVDRAVNGSGSLVLDAAGQPHISYYYYSQDEAPSGTTTYSVKYTFWTGSSWDMVVLEEGTSNSNYPVSGISLALDSAGYPHVSYTLNYLPLPCQACIKYARWTGVAWDVEIVEQSNTTAPTTIHSPKLVLDAADIPHIIYSRTERSIPGSYTTYLRYADQTSTSWDIQTIETGSIGGASLALDTNDRPHISYNHDNSLKYSYWTGNSWNVQTVDNESGGNVSLVLEADMPHLAYYISNSLKYTYWTGTSWITQTIDNESIVGEYNSLALDKTGYPHISYYDRTNGTLKYARWISDTWHIETIDITGVGVSQYSSIALDANGYPHIAYFSIDGGNWRLKYAHWTGSQWDLQTVDSGGNDGQDISLALDVNGYPHITYAYPDIGSTFALKYAHWTGSNWEIQTVDNTTSFVGIYNTLALDTVGQPHISYYDYGTYELKYAHWTGSTWDIQIVDSEGDAGRYTSLALDSADRPHISYQAANSYLRYAYWNGSTWIIQNVDSGGYVGEFTSLALDAADNPHISYSQTRNSINSAHVLKYAYWTGNSWDIQTVTNEAEADIYGADLALDANGYPRISYHDSYPNYDLKFAQLLPPLSLNKQATPSDGLQIGDILTYTLTISAPNLSIQLTDPIPENVDYVEGSITPPTAVYSPTARSIIWQGMLSDTEQIVRFEVTPNEVSGTESFTLSSPIVNTAWITDTAYNRSVSATVIVNGWKLFLPIIADSP